MQTPLEEHLAQCLTHLIHFFVIKSTYSFSLQSFGLVFDSLICSLSLLLLEFEIVSLSGSEIVSLSSDFVVFSEESTSLLISS